jgi:hypothetical protein
VDNVPVPDSSGTWEINGIVDFPAPPGTYEMVFSENWDGCELSVTTPFTINEPTISLDLTEGPPGTEVTVQGSGWPIARDRNIVSIQFTESGNEVAQATTDSESNFETTFTVPADAAIGEQKVIAVHTTATGWKKDAVFRVTGENSAPPQSYSLTASPSTAAFGGRITVNWTAPADHADNDWIGFYKVGNDNQTYISYQPPTAGATSGSLTFTAPQTADPTTAGQYEFRYLPKNEYIDVARSNAVTLGPGYAVTASPSTVAPGGTITVNWTAPEGHPGGDWIALYKAEDPNQAYQIFQYAPEGGTSGSLTFTVPTTATAGGYEFRYLPHGGYIDVARSSITVTGATNLVANAGPDQTVPGPSPVNVQFNGSGSTGDIVSYQWYDQEGVLMAEGVTPVITVDFGQDPQPGTQRTFTLVVADAQGNTAQDQVTITLGETPEEGEQTTITVPGNQPWTDTGLDLATGSSVSITASGTIKIAPEDPGKTPAGDPNCVGPSGRKIDPTAETWLTPGLTCWSLVGRIGDGAPFQVGTSLSISVETAGRLYLGINDEKGRFGNNSGSWTANITVGGAAQESPSPFNPQVTALRFFESGNEDLPLEQRVYAERFARETTRYINWELNLEHPAPGRRVDFKITAVYLRDTGAGSSEEFFRQTLDASVEADWTYSFWYWRYGFDDPGNWATGLYRVDIYFEGLSTDGQLRASEQFEIY